MKAMPVKGSHHALFGVVCLCWAWRSSRASGFPRAVKAMPVKGSHHALFWWCVFVLGVAVIPSLACREGEACCHLPALGIGCCRFDYRWRAACHLPSPCSMDPPCGLLPDIGRSPRAPTSACSCIGCCRFDYRWRAILPMPRRLYSGIVVGPMLASPTALYRHRR